MIRPGYALAFIACCYLVAGTIEYAADQVGAAMLLENSARAADMEECERAAPGRGRPRSVISLQARSTESWHHRTCFWDRR